MPLWETPLGWALMGLIALGSPALGYIGIRTMFSSSGNWNPLKSGAAAVVVGLGWVLALGMIVLPSLSGGSISTLRLGEFFSIAGMGLLILVVIISISTRGVNWMLHRTPTIGTTTEADERITSSESSPRFDDVEKKSLPRPRAPMRDTHEMDVDLHDDNAFAERLSNESKPKPIRVRNDFLPSSVPSQEGPSFSGAWEPSMQEGLGLLKEEATPPKRKASPPAPTEGKAINSLDRQLEQLKKDIKAFNASASKGVHTSRESERVENGS